MDGTYTSYTYKKCSVLANTRHANRENVFSGSQYEKLRNCLHLSFETNAAAASSCCSNSRLFSSFFHQDPAICSVHVAKDSRRILPSPAQLSGESLSHMPPSVLDIVTSICHDFQVDGIGSFGSCLNRMITDPCYPLFLHLPANYVQSLSFSYL